MAIYLAGVDGGASKTHCVVGDAEGNVLSEGFSTGSNYQVCGAEAAREAIESSIAKACEKPGIGARDIAYAVLGLAGADMEEDYAVLRGVCSRIFPSGRFRIINDSLVGLRAGIPENVGVVTVCGTGSACSGRNASGKTVTLRNLNYETGNCGGGSDIVRMALHFAFRSEEGTGRRTALEAEIPKLFGKKSMEEMVGPVRAMLPEPEALYRIPILVCALANAGDAVCQDILVHLGREMGEIAGGVARRLGMAGGPFKVTLVGGVFRADCPLLADEYTTAVHRAAPFAQIGIAEHKPAVGAYWLALEEYKRKEHG